MKYIKTPSNYEDLTMEDEAELVLWLGFLSDSINNAYTQIRRWKRTLNQWDLRMLFVAVVQIEYSRKALKRYLAVDKELWAVFEEFEKEYSRMKIGKIRNDLVHPNESFKLQDQHGETVSKRSVYVYGGYNVTTGEVTYLDHKFKVAEVISLVQSLCRKLRADYRLKLKNFYETHVYEGIIPWALLNSLEVESRSNRRSAVKKAFGGELT